MFIYIAIHPITVSILFYLHDLHRVQLTQSRPPSMPVAESAWMLTHTSAMVNGWGGDHPGGSTPCRGLLDRINFFGHCKLYIKKTNVSLISMNYTVRCFPKKFKCRYSKSFTFLWNPVIMIFTEPRALGMGPITDFFYQFCSSFISQCPRTGKFRGVCACIKC